MGDHFRVEIGSINSSANRLVEIAGALEAGRPDTELATEARAPHAHEEIGREVQRLTDHVFDQYQDAVALLAALATKLEAMGNDHVAVDGEQESRIDRLLDGGTFVAPADR